jgi:uncharacterized protein
MQNHARAVPSFRSSPSTALLRLDAAHARRFFVARQLLDSPRALPAAPASILEVTARFGSLQLDPLATTGAKNHDLVLAARIAGHRPSFIEPLLYGPPASRALFEAFNKSLNVLPVEELPFHRVAWEHARARYGERGGLLAAHPRVRAEILARLGREGPLPTVAFVTKGDVEVTWGWTGRTPATKAVLEALFRTGEISVAGRQGNTKTYHLTEALFPAEILAARVTPEEAVRHRVLSRFRAVGLLGLSASPEVWIGTAPAAVRREIVRGLVREGELFAIEIEGLAGERYAPSGDRHTLEATRRARRGRRAVAFLAPLDPFMWDRRLVQDLFGFEYRWEVYTPVAKRKHGYYVLPVLFGDALVGRIEPRIDRAAKVLHVEILKLQPSFRIGESPDFLPALDLALAAHAELAGAAEIRWRRGLRAKFQPK